MQLFVLSKMIQMKTFKRSLVVLSLLIGTSVFAQQQKDDAYFTNLLPKKGDFGTTLIVTGLLDDINLGTKENEYNNNLLFGRYYLKDQLVLRTGFGLNTNNSSREQSSEENDITTEIDSSSKQTTFNLSFGVEKHLNPSRRLDPYLFSQVDLSFIGKLNLETETRSISSVGTARSSRDETRDGGLGIALNLGGGFNYFLAQNFSVGTEVQFGLRYLREGGTTSITEADTDINGNVTSVFSNVDNTLKGTDISVSPSALINISYFF